MMYVWLGVHCVMQTVVTQTVVMHTVVTQTVVMHTVVMQTVVMQTVLVVHLDSLQVI